MIRKAWEITPIRVLVVGLLALLIGFFLVVAMYTASQAHAVCQVNQTRSSHE